MPWPASQPAKTLYEQLTRTAEAHGPRNALTFQMFSGPKDKAETLSWTELRARVTQAANMFRALGVKETDTIAFVLPNCTETAVTILGGAVAGIVNPINPLLEPEQIAAILRETDAKVVVTLKEFPKTDVAQKMAEAVRNAPDVQVVLEVDLLRYLTGLKKFIVPFIRPKNPTGHRARVVDWDAEVAKHPRDKLTFADSTGDRVAAYFHTGGTTGMPKVAQHTLRGMIYNGWVGHTLLFTEEDNVICPLPLFHVFACHVILMAMVASGGHVIFPTPQGYRGEGVFDNFWKLVERWKVTFIITVPTAIAAMMQRPVDADVSTVKTAFSGSAPLPVELFHRFEKATGVTLVEGYGLTEATCLVSCNPVDGEKKIGSVGIPLPHCNGCASSSRRPRAPSIARSTRWARSASTIPACWRGRPIPRAPRTRTSTISGKYLRTGRSGPDRRRRLSLDHGAREGPDHPGRPQYRPRRDRGGAGRPHRRGLCRRDRSARRLRGELPCVYVELVAGAHADEVEELMDWCKEHIHERAAMPKHLESCRNCRRRRWARCSSPTSGAGRSRGSMTPRWPRPGSRHACMTCRRTRSSASWRIWRRRGRWTRRLSQDAGRVHPALGAGGSVRRVRLFVRMIAWGRAVSITKP
jgi:acyl-CoA synthetase (AMP-forming)/AMP-acid ligase II